MKSIKISNIEATIQLTDNNIHKIELNLFDDNNGYNFDLVKRINHYLKLFTNLKQESFFINDQFNSYEDIKTTQLLRDKYENEIALVKNELEKKEKLIESIKSQYNNEINLLNIKFNQSVTNLNSTIQTRVDDEMRHIKENFKIKEEFYQNTIQELKQNSDIINSIYKDNNAILNLLTAPKTSLEIGNQGEAYIYNILSTFTQYNNQAKIENVSNFTASGDIKLIYDQMTCCIEIKNIKEDIGMSHIDKFHRDLDNTLHNYNSGIFISLKSKFAHKSNIDDMQIHIINKKPIIYICNAEYNTDKIILSIQVINRLLKLIKTNHFYEVNYFVEQLKLHISQLNTIEAQLKCMVNSIKIMEDTIVQSKKGISKLLQLEDTNINIKNEVIETPCGLKKYKGITKNYKSHVKTCELCLKIKPTG